MSSFPILAVAHLGYSSSLFLFLYAITDDAIKVPTTQRFKSPKVIPSTIGTNDKVNAKPRLRTAKKHQIIVNIFSLISFYFY